MTKVKNNQILFDQYKRAEAIYLTDSELGNLGASEVFDVQEVSKFMALTAITAGTGMVPLIF